MISLIAHHRRFSRFWAEFAEPILFEFPVVRIYVKFTQNYKTYHFCPVFAAVRGPRGARWWDCQEPGTRRDGKTWSVLVFHSYLSGNFRKHRKTAEDNGGRRGTVGEGGGRHNVVRPGPGLLLVGQVLEKTGRDNEMSSVLVLPRCEHCFCL